MFLTPDRTLPRHLCSVPKHSKLSGDEIRHLHGTWKKTGDPRVLFQIVWSHLRLVYKHAHEMAGRRHDLVEEYAAAGFMGLLIAIERYDGREEAKLSTYATWWIKKEMFEVQPSLVRQLTFTRSSLTIASRLERFKDARSIDRELTREEAQQLAHELNMERLKDGKGEKRKKGKKGTSIGSVTANLVMLIDRTVMVKEFSFHDTIKEFYFYDFLPYVGKARQGTDKRTYAEIVSSDEPSPEDEAIRRIELSERRAIVEQALDVLTPCQRRAFVLRYLGPEMRTSEEVAEMIGCTPGTAKVHAGTAFTKVCRRVRQIMAKTS